MRDAETLIGQGRVSQLSTFKDCPGPAIIKRTTQCDFNVIAQETFNKKLFLPR